MLSAGAIVDLHDQRISAWHLTDSEACADASNKDDSAPSGTRDPAVAWAELVVRQHRANFDLWHIEDEARAPGATDAELATVKRRIDATNQQRNDLVEALDRALLDWLMERGLPNPAAPLNSESPGLIIDRLSILALKIYHTREETLRENAPEGHTARNRERLGILEEQRSDLAVCLDELWREALAGTRRFKLYRQLKMYNDPSLNPAIYRQNVSG